MTTKELIATIADMNDMSKSDVKAVLDATLETIQDCLVEREDVILNGFGKFVTSERKARQGRNPQTGATIQIAASTVMRFKASSVLKKAVKNG